MDIESLTYKELAGRMSVKVDSARKTVRRKRWQKTTGNDGQVRILVPVEALAQSKGQSGGQGEGQSLPPYSRELEVKIEGLKALLESETRRADQAIVDRDRWHELAIRPWWKRLAG